MSLVDMVRNNDLSKVETKKDIRNALKIYHTEKTVQIVSMDRITTINRMLEDKGSQVSFPEKPAMRIDTKNR